MQHHSDIVIASAGSLWSILTTKIVSLGSIVLAYGPAVLTMLYIGLKIYYYVRRQHEYEVDRKVGQDIRESKKALKELEEED